ncbi:phage tail tape measure protein [Salinispora mooreana]|uniref:phage tail tape measure protein n=1 Tax=Salinispora mooreana TaxID=999545 RepID=UPI0003A12A3A|nr:phage tail tape measure protein [Salinispora mooreana]
MALKLGELVAYLKADDTHLAKGMQAAEGKLRRLGDRAKQHGPVLGAALAAGLGAGLVGSLNLDAARTKLTAQIGDPALAARIGEAAGAAYGRGFGDTATAAMDAARAVMASGLLPKDADAQVIEDITVKTQALATTYSQDVTQAARAAGQMVKAGLAGSAVDALDMLARGFAGTQDLSDDLLETMTQYGTQFRAVGLDGAAALGLIQQGLQGSARDADVVADTIKEINDRVTLGAAAEGLTALGLSAEQMSADFAAGGQRAAGALDTILDRLRGVTDPAKRAEIAAEVAGDKFVDMQDALFALDPSSATSALGTVDGAVGQLGETLEMSASQKLEAFKRQVQAALVERLAQAVPHIEATFGWLSRNSGWVVPLATGLGILAGVIGTIVVALKAWAAVQTVLNLALWTSPITWIVLAVVGLVAVIVLIATKTTWFQDLWQTAWGGIKTAVEWVLNWIVDGWEWAIGILASGVRKWWSLFSGTWRKVGNLGRAVFDWIVDKGSAWLRWVTGLPGRVGRATRGLFDGFKAAFKSALNWIIGKWNRLSFRIPGVSVPGLGQVWGGATLSTPNIPYLAKGGTALAPGLAVVGERGPELAYLNRGATIQPLTSGSAVAGLIRLLLTGEFRIRGGDLVLALREQVALRGGNAQQAIGSDL